MAQIKITTKVPRPFNSKMVDVVVSKAMEFTTGRSIKKSFEKTTNTWEHKPRFRIETRVTSKKITLSVFPEGEHAELYALVSLGAKSHTITPQGQGSPL